jgi:hypothetical protein
VLPGITGTLFTATFLERRLPSLARRGREPAPAPAAARAALAKWWARVRAECGPATSVRALADTAASRLASSLGFALESRRMLTDTLWLARLDHPRGSLPAAVVAWGSRFDAARRDVSRAALAAGSRWAVIYNGPSLRLADVGPGSSRRHLDFALDLVADGEAAARTLSALCGALRDAGPDGRPALDLLVDAADEEGRLICAGLRGGVVAALEQLCDGLAGGRGAVPLGRAYDEAQTAVYRLLFLSFAEARQLVPAWHPVYRRGYTMAALRSDAESRRTTGSWAAFQAMSRLAHEGCEAGDLRVPAFNGRLFAPGLSPMLERRRVGDDRMATILDALSFTTLGGVRHRISYAELGVEEIGSIYESLLDHEPAWQAGARPQTRARSGSRHVALARTGGARRKQTGTYYTPVPITRYLVRQALGPLTANAGAESVLSLRVVDPAMGSGAFLVAACRFLAEAYEEALVREGACHAADVTEGDRASFRRLVAQRCLYGVDLNPAAVQLARVSLWLTTLAADKPLGFLDHRLRCGDSLVGATLADILARRPARRARPTGPDQPLLFAHDEWHAAQRRALPVRRAFEDEPDDTAGDVRRKESALTALADRADRLKRVADLWCARSAGRVPSRDAEFDALACHLVDGTGPLPPAVAERVLGDASRAAGEARYLHWPLEFPEIFCDELGRERPDGGFDAVIGNPPWEMLRADGHRSADARAGHTMRFARDSGVYRARSIGHVNEYQLFVERAVGLARHGGRLGLVVPRGLAGDQGAAPLRHLLLGQCSTDAIVGFENRRGVFPIHRGVRFLLVTATRGGETREVRCRFGLQDPGTLEALAERPREEALPIAFTPALLERLSGPDLAIPDVRSPADLALAERLCALHPRLTGGGGWDARFGRELNATDDRAHFSTDGTGLPVIDGRNVSPFRVDVAGAAWRVDRATAARLLDETATFGRARLAFRDVAAATNRTTLIAGIVPAGCVTTHTLFCLRTRLPVADQWVLAALLNSYVANYFVRLRVSSHVSLAIVQSLPVPRVIASSALGRRLGAAARDLSEGRDEGGATEAILQADAALAYGLAPREFDLVLETFPLVAREARDRARDAFSRGGRR